MLPCLVGVVPSIFKVDLRWYTYAYLREGRETDLSPGLCYQLGGTAILWVLKVSDVAFVPPPQVIQ